MIQSTIHNHTTEFHTLTHWHSTMIICTSGWEKKKCEISSLSAQQSEEEKQRRHYPTPCAFFWLPTCPPDSFLHAARQHLIHTPAACCKQNLLATPNTHYVITVGPSRPVNSAILLSLMARLMMGPRASAVICHRSKVQEEGGERGLKKLKIKMKLVGAGRE